MQLRALVLAALLALPATSSTADVGDVEERGIDGWELLVDVHGWLPIVDSTATLAGRSVSAQLDIEEELGHLDGAAMGGFELRWQRLILYTDVTWTKLGFREDYGPVTRTLGPLSFSQGGVLVNVPAVSTTLGPLQAAGSLDMIILESWLGYRLLAIPVSDDGRDLRLDLTTGFRYWNLRARVELTMPPITIPGFTIQPSIPALPGLMLPGATVGPVTFGGIDARIRDEIIWTDWTLGARVGLDLAKHLRASVAGDVGGFGIDGCSDLTWSGRGALYWNLWRRAELFVGMKAVGVDFDRFQGVLWGPDVGIGWRF